MQQAATSAAVSDWTTPRRLDARTASKASVTPTFREMGQEYTGNILDAMLARLVFPDNLKVPAWHGHILTGASPALILIAWPTYF